MKNHFFLFALAFALTTGACSDSVKKTDLPQEMAARQEADRIGIMIDQDKVMEASKAIAEFEKTYGHTKTYEKQKMLWLKSGAGSEDSASALTAKRIVELENGLLAFRRESGDWPAPGQIYKPVDAWNNQLYWIVGAPENSYDLLVVSAGPDEKPGTGDELMIVWTEEDIGGYKDKQTGKMVGKQKKSSAGKTGKRKGNQASAKIMTLDELMEIESKHGTPKEKMVSLYKLNSAAKRSARAGQPKKGEMIMSLDEIKDKF